MGVYRRHGRIKKVDLEETASADFYRNREGIYGGLPKVRLDQ